MSALTPASTADEIVAHLRPLGSEENRAGMRRYGIKVDRALGISRPVQRDIARRIRRDHERAFALWASGIAEARFLAALTADPKRFTVENAHDWAAEFDSWDIVDGVSDLFVDTDHWKELIAEFARDEREFVRRTAFAMIAWAAVHRKAEPDDVFLDFLPLIDRHSRDDRNYVKKAVSWALRSIGKRSAFLHAAALTLARTLSASEARTLSASDDRTRRWIGREAVKELSSEKTTARLGLLAGHARTPGPGPRLAAPDERNGGGRPRTRHERASAARRP